MRGILVDSSAFLSLEDPAERSPADASSALRELVGARTRLVATNFVFDELCGLPHSG
jgi:predicted nucleic acid-binding protein